MLELLYHKGNLLIMTAVSGGNFLLYGLKFFELFCIENDFAKYCNLSI